jgi:nitrate reductase NapE
MFPEVCDRLFLPVCRLRSSEDMSQPSSLVTTKWRETVVFLWLTAVAFPLLAVMFVAGYGFVVWMWQMFRGPPSGLE